MNHRITFFFGTLCLLLSTSTVQAANITASLDRNPAMLDESFRLVLEADGSVDDDPDFAEYYDDPEFKSLISKASE